MEAEVMEHNGVQEHNIDIMIRAWQTFLSMYFAFNKVNYAHYGSYYTYIMVNVQQFYPGLKEFTSKRKTFWFKDKRAIDQRGEQTINQDAKASGKIIFIVRSLP